MKHKKKKTLKMYKQKQTEKSRMSKCLLCRFWRYDVKSARILSIVDIRDNSSSLTDIFLCIVYTFYTTSGSNLHAELPDNLPANNCTSAHIFNMFVTKQPFLLHRHPQQNLRKRHLYLLLFTYIGKWLAKFFLQIKKVPKIVISS